MEITNLADHVIRYNAITFHRTGGAKVQIPIEKFQTKYLKLIGDIQKNHNEIIITKLGKPIAKIIPIADKQTEKSIFGYMKDSVLVYSDILESIEENWEANE